MSLRDEKVKKYIGVNSSKVEAKYRGIDPRDSDNLIYRDEDGSYKKYIKGVVGKATTPKIKPSTVPVQNQPKPAVLPQAPNAVDNTYVPVD
jgi:hypothetical protein